MIYDVAFSFVPKMSSVILSSALTTALERYYKLTVKKENSKRGEKKKVAREHI